MAFKTVGMTSSTGDDRYVKRSIKVNFEPKRELTNARLLAIVIALLIGTFSIYASLFYAPSFTKKEALLGYSSHDNRLPEPHASEVNANILSSYTGLFKIRRAFLRSGQAFHVRFALSPGQTGYITIYQCSEPAIVEVIKCDKANAQTINYEIKGRGSKSFAMQNAGFYAYDDKVVTADGSEIHQPYHIAWSRRYSVNTPS